MVVECPPVIQCHSEAHNQQLLESESEFKKQAFLFSHGYQLNIARLNPCATHHPPFAVCVELIS